MKHFYSYISRLDAHMQTGTQTYEILYACECEWECECVTLHTFDFHLKWMSGSKVKSCIIYIVHITENNMVQAENVSAFR